MLQYNRTDVSEEINFNKTSASKECDIGHYWYFKDVGFKYEPYVCNDCHGVWMMAYELKNIAILIFISLLGVDHRCILWGIRGHSIITFALRGGEGFLKMRTKANGGEEGFLPSRTFAKKKNFY